MCSVKSQKPGRTRPGLFLLILPALLAIRFLLGQIECSTRVAEAIHLGECGLRPLGWDLHHNSKKSFTFVLPATRLLENMGASAVSQKNAGVRLESESI